MMHRWQESPEPSMPHGMLLNLVSMVLMYPTERMKNPYKGKDGMEYHSPEALNQANADYRARMFRKE